MKLVWEQGGEGQQGGEGHIEALDGDRVVVISDRAAPPGTPLLGRDELGRSIQIKVRSCRRVETESRGSEGQSNSRFRIEGKLFNLRREVREALLVALKPSSQ